MDGEHRAQPVCPGCHGSEWVEIDGSDQSYRLFACVRCGCCRIDGGPVVPSRLYDDYYSADDARRLSGIFDVLWRRKRRARARLILRHTPPGAVVCDVGCERGELLNLLKDAGCRVMGTQMSTRAAEFAWQRFGIRVYVGELPHAPFANDGFDVVLMLNVLEHLPDPERYVEQIARMVRPGGAFWVEVPNVASFTARVTKKHWLHHDPPHHLWGFNNVALTRLLERHGFVVEQRYPYTWEHGPIGALQSWLNAMTRRKNVIFGIVQNGLSREPTTLAVQLAHILISAFLLPAAACVTLVEGLSGNPQVMLVRARREGG